MRFSLALTVLLCLPYGSPAADEERRDTVAEDTVTVITDFSGTDAVEQWMIVNDGVMGGLSSSRFEVADEGHGVFTGTVSLENNGGFASTRAIMGEVDLSGHEGITLRVRGDGQKYQFRIRTDQNFDGVAYRQTFDTEADEWVELKLPFADFVASYRGRVISDAPPVDPDRIMQIGFLIADKQAGEFRLEIARIAAYK